METLHQKFCRNCGKELHEGDRFCPNCGADQQIEALIQRKESNERWMITLLLCIWLGCFGAHRFYTKHTTTAVLQLITLGGCGIWTFVDLIIILMGNFKDAEGNPIQYK